VNPFIIPEKVFISRYPCDMRFGIQRLAAIITLDLGCDPMDGSLYVFISRTSNKAKMLRFETSGWCLYYCRLCQGTFRFNYDERTKKPVLTIERRQLIWLLEGLEIEQPKAAKLLASHSII
jgi:transposase